jgi:HEAT repeat protein
MVRSGAAYALGELKSEQAVEVLAQLVATDPCEAGEHAADALAKIGIHAAPALIKILPDKQAWVRVRAVRALAAIASKDAISALFEALEDESYLVRHHAEEALARLGVGQMVYFQI